MRIGFLQEIHCAEFARGSPGRGSQPLASHTHDGKSGDHGVDATSGGDHHKGDAGFWMRLSSRGRTSQDISWTWAKRNRDGQRRTQDWTGHEQGNGDFPSLNYYEEGGYREMLGRKGAQWEGYWNKLVLDELRWEDSRGQKGLVSLTLFNRQSLR